MVNDYLAQIAQAIFKSWFVNFEPFSNGKFQNTELGSIPVRWKVQSLGDISQDIICGKTPSTKHKEYYGHGMPFITIPDMHDSIFNTSTERELTLKGVNSQLIKTLPRYSICVSCIATAGLVTLTTKPSQTNQQINSIICKKGISQFYIYETMCNLSGHIKMLGSSGSATCNLNKAQFSKIKIVIPTSELMLKYHSLVESIFLKIETNQEENITLTKIRDALLPKLMAGELSVANL